MIYFVQPALPKDRMTVFKQLSEKFGREIRIFFVLGSLDELTRLVCAEFAAAIRRLLIWFGAMQCQCNIACGRRNRFQVISFRSYGQAAIISLADGRAFS